VKKSNSSVKKSNSSVKKRLFFTLSSVRKSRFDKENLFLALMEPHQSAWVGASKGTVEKFI
jgi:hypothetical protein